MTQPLALDPWPDTIAWRKVSGRLILIEELQVIASTVIVVAANLAAMAYI